jgi:hypothetical protein
MNIFIKSIFLILFLISSANGALLLDYITPYQEFPPIYLSNQCVYSECISLQSNNTKNGQIITVSSGWEFVSGIGIALKKYPYQSETPSITIRVYTSTTDNPATSNLYLWDSLTVSPSNTVFAEIDFTFDTDINFTNTPTDYLFIEIQETYSGDNIASYNYGSKVDTSDYYPGGELYQLPYNGNWTFLEYWFTDKEYADMSFKIFGDTYYLTPEPTVITPQPTTTPIVNNTDMYNNTYGTSSIYNPNNTEGIYSKVPNGSILDSGLNASGVCTSGSCTAGDIIEYLNLYINIFFYLTFGLVIYRLWSMKT